MSRYSHPTSAQVRATAQKAVDAFAYYGLACCLVGGAACQLYGTSRTPGDVDMVILTTSYDTERLKAMLVARDPTFYLRPAKTFGATYKVLWARIGYSYAQSDACKVDILTPGIMNIPDVPREHIVTIDGFPVMPMIPLLLLKLQAWMDHRAATKPYLHDKQYQDVQDIRELLTIAARRADNIKEASWVPPEFMAAAKHRIGEFRALISSDREPWKAIGYKFAETNSKPKASGGKASVVASGSGVRYQW